jgi:hypothetical protein
MKVDTAFVTSFISDVMQTVDSVHHGRFAVLSMKNAVFCDVTPRASIRTEVSEERIATIIRVSSISELGITLAVTSK